VLEHADPRTTARPPAARRAPATPSSPPLDAQPPASPAGRLAGADALSLTLARAVAERSGKPTTALLQRLFYDPASVTPNARQPAADYVWNNGKAILEAYVAGQYGNEVTDPAMRHAFEATFAQAVTDAGIGPPQAGQLTAVAKNMAAGLVKGTLLTKNGLLAAGQEAMKARTLELAVRTLNVLEQDTKTEAVLATSLVKNVYVGTEFTFTSESLRDTEPGTNDDAARAKLAEWKALVAQDKSITPAPVITPKKGKADDTGVKTAWRFTYQVGTNRWWWALDLDPGCLETQTAPATKLELDAVSHIMQRHIFGPAASVGLAVDATPQGGGGHISLDMKTLFGGSPELLLAVLTELQDDVVAWQGHFDYIDAPNSPWLADQGLGADKSKGAALAGLTSLVTRLDGEIARGEKTFDAVTTELESFHATVLNLWADTASEETAPKAPSGGGGNKAGMKAYREAKVAYDKRQKDAANVLANPDHYQAVNVQHLVPGATPKKEAARRMELRAIGAQTDAQRLKADLQYIYAVLERARQKVDATVSARRDARA
jgi:hypothetical protein